MTIAPAVSSNLSAISNGARWDQNPAAPTSAAIEAHFTTEIRAALLRQSCARPLALHACHAASSSGFAAGGAQTFCDSTDATKVDMPGPLFLSRVSSLAAGSGCG